MRTAADSYVAYSQKCTHLSCAVYYAQEQNRLECPCHQGYFSDRDGSVLQGPPQRAAAARGAGDERRTSGRHPHGRRGSMNRNPPANRGLTAIDGAMVLIVFC